MKIGIANDHGGYELKFNLTKILEEKGYTVVNYGSDTGMRVDYPDYAFKLCHGVINNEIDLGIVICKTGIGVSIASNKVKGIRCAHVSNIDESKLARLHNNANVIAMSYKNDINIILECINNFITTDFANEERHIRRINMITEYERVD